MSTFQPDHNGECIHCDEYADAHGAGGTCPTDPGQAVANSEDHCRASTRWNYLNAGLRVGLIEAAKKATEDAGIPVYHGHHVLCSNFLRPVEGCWQCRIITEGLTDDPQRPSSRA